MEARSLRYILVRDDGTNRSLNMSRVGIIGYSVEGFRDRMNARADEAVFSVVRSALDQTKLTRDDIDTVVNCGHDAYDGATISSGMKCCPSGGYEKATVRLQNGGIYALHQAVAQIWSDKYDVVVISSDDTVETNPSAVSTISQDALYNQPLGLSYHHTHGLLANRHLMASDVTEEDYAEVAAKNYRAAVDNPHAHRQEAHSAEEVMDSDRVVGPLRELEIGPDSKGAAALVLASEDVAEDVGAAAWIEGIGVGSSRNRFTETDERLSVPALWAAAEDAYERAGIDDPREDIDAAEVYDPVVSQEILGYEALGLCETGEGAHLLRDGITNVDGDLPVNASGGALATNPLNTGGLFRTINTVMLVNGDLGTTDVNVDTAVATDSDCMLGETGRTDGVVVVRGGA